MIRVLLPLILAIVTWSGAPQAADYDLAINHGRVIDPETGLDAVRHVGVRDGIIEIIATTPLKAARARIAAPPNCRPMIFMNHSPKWVCVSKVISAAFEM